MLPSFGVSQKIIENPYYNLGVALPFVCAFYLLNMEQGVVWSWFDYEFGPEVSSLLRIMFVGFFYYAVVLYFAIASHFSLFVKDSKAYWILPIIVCISGLKLIFGAQDEPKIGLIFSAHAVLIMLFHWLGNGSKEYVSLIVTQVLGAIASIACFSAGVMWFYQEYIFVDEIGAVLGIDATDPKSLNVGSIMMFTLGYVIFYGVFQVSRMLNFESDNS